MPAQALPDHPPLVAPRSKRAEPNRASMTAAQWGLLGILAWLWGGSFFFNAVAVAEMPPFTLVAVRLGLACLTLWGVLLCSGTAVPRGRGLWGAFAAMGLINNAVPFSLIVWGQSHIASGTAAILNASTPLFGVVFAHWMTADERLTGGRLVGVLLGLAGVGVMMGGAGFAGGGIALLAELACLGAAVSYALAGLYGRRFHRMGVAPLATATGQLTASSLMLMPLALLVDRPWTLPVPSPAAIGALVAVAIASTALAYILFFRLLAGAGATNLMLVTLLVPVTAILLGVTVLGEPLLGRQIAGMALIALGLVAIDGRFAARLRRRTPGD